jgi:queuosine precursor transporter
MAEDEGVARLGRQDATGPDDQAATRQRQVVGAVLAAAYVLTIILANYAISHWGRAPAFPGGPHTVPVWPGLEAPSGVLFVGVAFTLRDLTQEWLGRKAVVVAIVVGAVLSWWVSSGDIALASGIAFLFSELADFGVYTPLKERRWGFERRWRAGGTIGWLLAVGASNLVGLIVDSILFLWIAFGSLEFLKGQVVGKLWMTVLAIPVLLVLRRRAIPRRSRPADEPMAPSVA